MNYTVGKLAKAAGVNVETVRFYEREKLIQKPPKPREGFRCYSKEILARIQFIKRAQELGFTLKEIRNLLSLSEARCGDVQVLAKQKLENVKAKITDLERLASVLEDLLKQCQTNPNQMNCPIIEALLTRKP